MGWLFAEPKRKRRKNKKVEARKRAHENRRKGKQYEADVANFLKKKGYVIIRRRHRTPKIELDLVVRKNKDIFLVECKNLKAKINTPIITKVLRNLKKSEAITKNGIIVSRKGLDEAAAKLAKKHKLIVIKYGGSRKKKESSLWWPTLNS